MSSLKIVPVLGTGLRAVITELSPQTDGMDLVYHEGQRVLRVRRFVISDLTESSTAYATRCVHCFEPGPVFSPKVPVLKSRIADLQDPPPVLFPAPPAGSVFNVPEVMVVPFLFVDPLTFLSILFHVCSPISGRAAPYRERKTV